ncbi:hypothetical protein [Aliidiomarina soli]|uniref:Uncharacterized protein n=1 Tax=Aliidiomarina soli TaxID=1928574 RepID=A0A432WH88_9GAMM|nr:hypothetical protein [Aliidiomarina soli]RUO33091.1 hypothetical protein CWE14_07630 [Aliidiomarina soli]
MTLTTGCTTTSAKPQKHRDLLPEQAKLTLILIDEAYFFDLKESDEAAFHLAAAEIKADQSLSDNFDKFLSQFIAKIPFYGENWRDTYNHTLVFYVQGHQQLDPLRGYQVTNAAGETISQGFQLIPGDHLLELSILPNKYSLNGDLQIGIAHKSGNMLEFTIPQAALPSPPG